MYQPPESTDSRRFSWKRAMPIGLLLLAAVGLGISLFGSGEPTAATAPVVNVRVVQTHPHDPTAFCQGLAVHNGQILESTGHYGQSRLRLVDLTTGRPSVDIPLNEREFGEGITVWQDRIFQLTWKAGYIIIWDAKTFQRIGTVPLRQIDRRWREGWGITHDEKHLIISDGSSMLRFIDPRTMRLVRKLQVRDGPRYVSKLNELEYVEGLIFANIWYRDQIARINPRTGRVEGWLELRHIRPAQVQGERESVLNGIAWDATAKRLFVTGKYWPALFEITW